MATPAAIYDITADQGATFTLSAVWSEPTGTPIDLTGYTARMQVRPTVDSATVTLELTTGNGRIVLDPAAGLVALEVAASAMTMAGSFVYDLELVAPSGEVTRLLMGRFELRPEVTR